MSFLPPLSPDVRRALDTAVNGEPVLWAAQPQGKRQRLAFVIWGFAIPWTAFALFWEAMAFMPWFASTRTPPALTWSFGIVFPLFGLPFIAIGLWMLWLPIRTVRRARDTVYALTDKRLVSLVLGTTTEVKSVLVDRIGPMTRQQGPDGWGSLSISTHSRIDSDRDRITEKFDMIGIPDVAGLERRIIDLQTS